MSSPARDTCKREQSRRAARREPEDLLQGDKGHIDPRLAKIALLDFLN